MTANVITTRPDTLVISAIKVLIKNHISGMPVVDDEGNLIGGLTLMDALEGLAKVNEPKGGPFAFLRGLF